MPAGAVCATLRSWCWREGPGMHDPTAMCIRGHALLLINLFRCQTRQVFV